MFNHNAIPGDLDDRLREPVTLKVFTTLSASGYRQCPACENTIDVVKQLQGKSSKIRYDEISIIENPGSARHYQVTRAPTIIVAGHGIRYTGAPMGMELAPFVHTLVMASTGITILGNFMEKAIDRVRKARLELIVTPTCPYCSQAALIENSLVMESKGKLTIDIVESYENPDIARKYQVTGVPVTIIDGDPATKITGVPTLAMLLQRVT